MDIKKMLTGLQRVKAANDGFLRENRNKMVELLMEEDVAAEEALQQEIMFEILEKMQRLNKIIRYLENDIVEEGTLSRNEDGSIMLNGKVLSPLYEIEVYAYDDFKKMAVWTRTFVSMAAAGEVSYLVGLGRDLEIDGIRARIRGQ